MKMLRTITLSVLLIPAVLWADPPGLSVNELTPVIPFGPALGAAALAKRATPTLPRRDAGRRKREGGRSDTSVSLDLLEVTPRCIVIANATIGHTGTVQQTTSVNTLNVNCD